MFPSAHADIAVAYLKYISFDVKATALAEVLARRESTTWGHHTRGEADALSEFLLKKSSVNCVGQVLFRRPDLYFGDLVKCSKISPECIFCPSLAWRRSSTAVVRLSCHGSGMTLM